MARADIIRAGSFRGVPFNWRDSDTDVGRRVVKHEYPLREKPYGEDLGRAADDFKLSVFVNGDDWEDKRDALIRAMRQKGAGRLVHPNFGEIDITVTSCTIRETADRLGEATFAITGFEAGDITFTSSIILIQGARTMKASNSLRFSAQALFAKLFNITGLSDFVGTSAIGDLNAVYRQAKDALFDVRAASDTLLDFEAKASFLKVAPLYALGQSVNLAGTIGSVIESVSFLGKLGPSGAWDVVFSTLSSFAFSDLDAVRQGQLGIAQLGLDPVDGVIPPPPSIAADLPDRVQQAVNSDAVFSLVRQSALAEAAQAAVATPFVSHADAIDVRDSLAQAIDDEALRTTDDDVFNALSDLRQSAITEITMSSVNLPDLVTFTPTSTLPASVIAHQLYDDPTWADDIVARNHIRYPGFITGGQGIQVLSDV